MIWNIAILAITKQNMFDFDKLVEKQGNIKTFAVPAVMIPG
jgi:hypothetical protein